MITIINPIIIVEEHLESLKESASILTLLLLFFLLPFSLSLVLIGLSIFPSVNFLNAILTAVSIISGLMFSLLFIVLDIGRKIKEDLENATQSVLNWKRYKLLRQLLANIAFSILLGIILIFIILVALLLRNHINQFIWVKKIGSLVFYYASSIYLITLLQILKRSYVLLEHELRLPKKI